MSIINSSKNCATLSLYVTDHCDVEVNCYVMLVCENVKVCDQNVSCDPALLQIIFCISFTLVQL